MCEEVDMSFFGGRNEGKGFKHEHIFTSPYLPLCVHMGGQIREAAGGEESREMERERERLLARAKEEEKLFQRVPLTKVERTKLKALTNKNKST